MNSKNIKAPDSHRLLPILTEKIELRRKDKYVALSNLSTFHTWKNIKMSFKNNKTKISATIWNEEFELPDGFYSIWSDVQDYFEHILKKHGEKTVNPSIRMYINKIENGITFKITTRYHLELLTPETMKLLRSTKSKRTKIENGENVSYLDITEVVLIHSNVVINSYQQKSLVYIYS